MLKYSEFFEKKQEESNENVAAFTKTAAPTIGFDLVNVKATKEKSKSTNKEPKTPQTKEPKTPTPKMEIVKFNGKVAEIPKLLKPSLSIKIFESKNIDKNKLHYIVSEQKNSIVVLKYNIETEVKLNEFTQILLEYYKKHSKMDISKVIVEGSDNYSIIKNIEDPTLLTIIKEDLIKLLR